MQRICWFLLGAVFLLPRAATGSDVSIDPHLRIGGVKIRTAELPTGLVLRTELGIVCHESVDGQIVHRANKGHLFETRAVITPKGDFLLMFPQGRHYGSGHGKVLMMARTPQGHLWTAHSNDDGKTWTAPKPSPLVHPDAPPMLFLLSDGKTLAAFHHNRHSQTQYVGLTAKMEGQKDRSEIWVAFSTDDGETWTPPRFVFTNALAPDPKKAAWYNHQCSYMDVIVDGDTLHLFCPHRWARVLHLRLKESDLTNIPEKTDFTAAK